MENNREALYAKTIEEAQKLFDELLPLTQWNSESKTGDIEYFTRTDEATGLKMARGEGLINRPVEQVVDAIQNNESALKWDDTMGENASVEETGIYTVTRSLDKKKMFVSQRETILVSISTKQEDGTVSLLGRSVDHPGVPENKDYVRAFIYVWGWKIVPDKSDPNKTHATYIIFVDPKGKVPTTLFNAFVKEQAQNVGKIKKFVEAK